jgi:Tfp pilus assembly protein PilN
MNFDLKWDVRKKVSHWWDLLAASVVAGSSGLGAYLGRGELTLVQVQTGPSGIKVRHWANFLFESGKIADLAPILKETVAAWDLETCPLSLAVSPHLAFFRRVTLPHAVLENLTQVVAYELDRFLPLPADSLYYGFQVLDETAAEIHLMLMALPRDRMEACLGLLTEATLRPIAIQLAPVAVGNLFALRAKSLPSSWLVLHLGDSSFELTHFQGDKLRAFAQGSHLQGKELSRAVLAKIDDLAKAPPAPKALGLYGSGMADFKVGPLKRPDLEVIYPSYFPIQDLSQEMHLDAVLPAVGAGLACVRKTPLGTNLLPPEERAPVRAGRFSVTAILGLILLGLVLLWGTSALIHTRVQLYRVNREIAKLTPEAKGMESLLRESRALAKQMESLRKIGQSPDKLIILKDLTRLIPDNTWLFTLHLGKYVDITGMSRSASDLIPLLDRSGLFKKTEFASPIITDANKFEHFKIKAEFKGLAPGL